MAETIATIPVYFKDKPAMGCVHINEADFDPKIHSKTAPAEKVAEKKDEKAGK